MKSDNNDKKRAATPSKKAAPKAKHSHPLRPPSPHPSTYARQQTPGTPHRRSNASNAPPSPLSPLTMNSAFYQTSVEHSPGSHALITHSNAGSMDRRAAMLCNTFHSSVAGPLQSSFATLASAVMPGEAAPPSPSAASFVQQGVPGQPANHPHWYGQQPPPVASHGQQAASAHHGQAPPPSPSAHHGQAPPPSPSAHHGYAPPPPSPFQAPNPSHAPANQRWQGQQVTSTPHSVPDYLKPDPYLGFAGPEPAAASNPQPNGNAQGAPPIPDLGANAQAANNNPFSTTGGFTFCTQFGSQSTTTSTAGNASPVSTPNNNAADGFTVGSQATSTSGSGTAASAPAATPNNNLGFFTFGSAQFGSQYFGRAMTSNDNAGGFSFANQPTTSAAAPAPTPNNNSASSGGFPLGTQFGSQATAGYAGDSTASSNDPSGGGFPFGTQFGSQATAGGDGDSTASSNDPCGGLNFGNGNGTNS